VRFTVLWARSAERQLAQLWLNAGDRSALRDAADRLDAALAERADSLGESRSGDVRIAFAPPLAVEFEVLEKDRTARVLAVWSFTPPRPTAQSE
jgi:hypothetical protein